MNCLKHIYKFKLLIMKKLFTLILLGFATLTFAQEKHEKPDNAEKMTPEQKVILQTKQTTLALDLDDSQYKKLLDLNKKKLKKKKYNKENYKNLSADDKFELKSELIDAQITYQREVKKILNDEQYKSWKKMRGKKMRSMQHKKHKKEYQKRKRM